MAEALKIPLDFERLPEFRLLVNALRARSAESVGARVVEANAVFLWMRLYVELALQARSTNRPGYLTADGRLLFESTLQPLFGEDCPPVKVLSEAGILEQRDGNVEEWFCARFAQTNPHFSGDYVSREKRGNILSQIARTERHVAHEANQQAMLLGGEIFKKENGETMSDAEVQRVMRLIKRLDNCLCKPTRRRAEFGEGLISDAYRVSERYAERRDDLNEFYAWLMNHREHPRVPQTAEGLLRQFDELMALAVPNP
jgi:hypothetical protein